MTDVAWRRISSSNAEYQVLLALTSNRRTRNREDVFLVEGVRNMSAAIARGWEVDSVVTYRGCRRSHWANELVSAAGARQALELPVELFDALTERTERPELLVTVRRRTRNLDDLAAGERLLAVLMDRPGSPGNLGTIIRTADAMGADALLVSGHGADLYDPKCVRATAGSLFALATFDVAGPSHLATWLARHGRGVTVIVADEGGDAELGVLAIERPVIVVLGNETTGPSRGYLEMADHVVSIPMSGSASSLNVAEANAMVLFEIDRQDRLRRRAP